MENNVDTIIGVNVSLKGNLFNKGSIQINGNVDGEIKSDENILIGQTATIKGPVVAKKIEVSGEVRGLVEASEKLEINSTGKIFGDVNTKTLIIKEGAVFVGQSVMPSNGKTIEDKSTPAIKNSPAQDKMGFFAKK